MGNLKEINRILIFNRKVSKKNVGKLIKKILKINEFDDLLEEKTKQKRVPIKLYIDTNGGNLYSGFSLLCIMKSSKTPIHTYVMGSAMSCGFLISICGHKRFCHKLSTFMWHNISTEVAGTVSSIDEDLTEVKRVGVEATKIIIEKTKITNKRLESLFKEKNNLFFNSTEALKLGIVDEII